MDKTQPCHILIDLVWKWPWSGEWTFELQDLRKEVMAFQIILMPKSASAFHYSSSDLENLGMPHIWYKDNSFVSSIHTLATETPLDIFGNDSNGITPASGDNPSIITIIGKGNDLQRLVGLHELEASDGSATLALLDAKYIENTLLLNAIVSTGEGNILEKQNMIKPISHVLSDVICFIVRDMDEGVRQVLSWIAVCKQLKMGDQSQKLTLRPVACIIIYNDTLSGSRYISESDEKFQTAIYNAPLFEEHALDLMDKTVFTSIQIMVATPGEIHLPKRVLQFLKQHRRHRKALHHLWSSCTLVRLISGLEEQFSSGEWQVDFCALLDQDDLSSVAKKLWYPFLKSLDHEQLRVAMSCWGHAFAWSNARKEHGK